MSVDSKHEPAERRDVRTIIGTGVALGVLTAVGVAVFALVSRALGGRTEVVVQSLMVLAGGGIATYLPARAVRPRGTEAIGWSAFIGVIGAWTFTVLDIIALRPMGLYSWRWDAIGGGSGWWYIPVWWMGATLLAWMGALVYSSRTRASSEVNPVGLAIQAVGIAVVLFGVMAVTRMAPFSTAVAALAFAISVAIQVPVAAALARR
jgi:hypothetical protein